MCKKEKQLPNTTVGTESCSFIVALQGFEPRQAVPETDVLPLHYKAIFSKDKGSIFFRNDKNIFLINFVATTKKHIIFHQQDINE